jgi:hypothetical protein
LKVALRSSKTPIKVNASPDFIIADFSTEALKARRVCTDVFQNLKESNCQSRSLYPAKLHFIIDREIKPRINKN